MLSCAQDHANDRYTPLNSSRHLRRHHSETEKGMFKERNKFYSFDMSQRHSSAGLPVSAEQAADGSPAHRREGGGGGGGGADGGVRDQPGGLRHHPRAHQVQGEAPKRFTFSPLLTLRKCCSRSMLPFGTNTCYRKVQLVRPAKRRSDSIDSSARWREARTGLTHYGIRHREYLGLG
jgi:hypothetical protein